MMKINAAKEIASKIENKQEYDMFLLNITNLKDQGKLDQKDYMDLFTVACKSYVNHQYPEDIPYGFYTVDEMFDRYPEEWIVMNEDELSFVIRKAIMKLSKMTPFIEDLPYNVRMANIIQLEFPSPYGLDSSMNLSWLGDYMSHIDVDLSGAVAAIKQIEKNYREEYKKFGCSDYTAGDIMIIDNALSILIPNYERVF